MEDFLEEKVKWRKPSRKKRWIFSYEVYMNWKNDWVEFKNKYHRRKDAEKARDDFLRGRGYFSKYLDKEKEVRNIRVYQI